MSSSMASCSSPPLIWSLVFSVWLYYIAAVPTATCSHVHIVYLGAVSGSSDPHLTTAGHVRLLSSVYSSKDEAKKAMVYSYRSSFSGFAALMNVTQATKLAGANGVISVFRSKTLQLHTTRSWDFMGLTVDPQNHHRQCGADEPLRISPLQSQYGADVVVGILDTGVWPESESFQEDPCTGPVPVSWKGKCVSGEGFDPVQSCHRKLVGARYYIAGFEAEFGPLNTSGTAEYRSPRDRLGHGTHTASTAVGTASRGPASFFGLGIGTARGGSPASRLAVYKICWFKDLQGRCSEADILAAFDDALADGVGVISASFGASPPLTQFFASSADIGSFHAAMKGVPVVFSAGNDGPEMSVVQNVSPWGICVAAANIDRAFPTKIVLGNNNITFMGESFMTKPMQMRLTDSNRYFDDGACDVTRWKGILASGRIVLCFSTVGQVSSAAAALSVFAINGSAMIYAEPLTRKAAQDDLLPSVHVDINQGTRILYLIQSSKRDPVVQVFPSETVIGRTPAPSIAYFSSRGPSSTVPKILKPDLAAPGVNILAAWPSASSPSTLPIDFRSVNWNFNSGTSMSCPHVTGIVALLRSAHPDWSPAAIKSALMTTAYSHDTSRDSILAGGTMKPADPFDMGAGHVDPLRAFDPGLVYDADARDHVLFLCSLGYTADQISRLVIPIPGLNTTCPDQGQSDGGPSTTYDLNYPAIVLPDLRESSVVVKRTVTNVGPLGGAAVYRPSVVSPHGVRVTVWPRRLVFTCAGEKVSYYVTVSTLKRSQGRYDYGHISWTDGYHRVRIPLAVRVNNYAAATHGDVFQGDIEE